MTTPDPVRPTVTHIGRGTIQDTPPALLSRHAIRVALIGAGIALPTDPGATAARAMLSSARASLPEGGDA